MKATENHGDERIGMMEKRTSKAGGSLDQALYEGGEPLRDRVGFLCTP